MSLSGKYRQWVTLDENKKFNDSSSWQGAVLKDLFNRYVGVKSYKGENDIPGIIFEAVTNTAECIPVIGYNRGIRDLSFYGTEKGKDAVFLPGGHQLFSGRIMLLNEEEMDGYIEKARKKGQAEKEKIRASLTIKRGDRKSTRLNSSHTDISRMPSSA